MGYSPEFIENFQHIADRLRGEEGDSELIEIVDHTDDICEPCPERCDKFCTSQARIEVLDQAHAMALKLEPQEQLTWKEAKYRIKATISIDIFHTICAPCPWKESGVCEKALEKLIKY